MKQHWILGVCVVVLLGSCTEGPALEPRKPTAGAAPVQGNAVDIPADVQRALGLGFVEVEVRHVASTLRLPGAFEYTPDARRQYATPLGGQVEFAVTELEAVEPGQLLARVRSDAWLAIRGDVEGARQEELAAVAERRSVEAEAAELSVRIEALRARIEQLADAGARSAELDGELLGLEAALPRTEAAGEVWRIRAESAAARAELALERARSLVSPGSNALPQGQPLEPWAPWLELRAVAAGRVERLHVPAGAHVAGTAALLDVVDPTALRLRVLVLASDVERVQTARTARIVPLGPTNGPSESLEADWVWGLGADPVTRARALFATPRSEGGWPVAGAAAHLEFELGSSGGAVLAVPRAAIVRDGLQHFLFRLDPKNPARALRVEADMGVDDGRWVELKSGVQRGDRVVLQGVYELKLATQSAGLVQKGGHMHADGTFHAEDH